MWDSVALAQVIGTSSSGIDALLEHLNKLESDFATLMGDLLQDGYYSDNTYGPGQEQALYNDSYEMMKVLSRPQMTYNLTEKDIVNCEGYSDEVYTMNIAVHFYEDILGINDYGFVSQIEEYLDRANTRGVEVKTDELNIQGKSFASFLGRITDAAQMLKDKQAIYDMAKALSPDGTLATYKLNGIIDVLTNQLVSTKSNWSTDENGNIIFVAADESSAMMLSGAGFMVANGKKEDGNWNWRTFGTGEGFTADLITAGILRAGAITILGSEQFYWNEDNIYILDPSNKNRQIRIGRYNNKDMGIAYTTDGGETWQTAIGFDGVHLSAVDVGKGGRNYIHNSRSLTDVVVGSLMSILVQPESVYAKSGETITFTVEAMGVDTYQWYEVRNGALYVLNDGTKYTGTGTNSLSFEMTSGDDKKKFQCVLKDKYDNTTYTLAVSSYLMVLNITQQPVSTKPDASGKVAFETAWTGNSNDDNDWEFSVDNGDTWMTIVAGTVYRIPNVGQNKSRLEFTQTSDMYGRLYRCRINGYNGGYVYTDIVYVIDDESIRITDYTRSITARNGDPCEARMTVAGPFTGVFWEYLIPGGTEYDWDEAPEEFVGGGTTQLTFTMSAEYDGAKLRGVATKQGDEVHTNPIPITLIT